MTESNVYKEDNKNLSGIEGKPELQNYEPITIIFTTQPYRGREKTSNILIVSKDNFKSYFGPIFSARATFAFTKAINPNFWEISRLQNTLEGIGEASIDNVIAKRPYIDENQFKKQIRGLKNKN